MQRPVVVICDDPAGAKRLRKELDDIPMIVGDPTLDETLSLAGVERASGVAACTRSDKDNLIVTLTARQMNPDIRGSDKIRNVGADAVVSPHHIGALRIASELIRPTVVDFLDLMLRDGTGGLRVDEVGIPEDSPAVGTPVGSLDLGAVSNALLVACRTADGDWLYNPPSDLVVEAGTVLILLGTPDDVGAVADSLEGEMISRPMAAEGG